ncbi:MAG TPA: anti-sigma factor [Actinomycetota bacterium]|nr:anti-sigma factor [Actinomycetota bacterium]
MTHDQLRELVPIYALDALDGDEELAVRAHLVGCPDCRQSLEACQQAAGSLALAAEPVAPPAALRQRVLQEVATSPQAGLQVAPAGKPRAAGAGAGTGRVPSRREWWQVPAAVLAAAVIVVLGGVSISLSRQLNTSRQEVAHEQRFIAALGAPVLTTVPMVAAGSDEKAAGQLYVSASGNSAGLVVTGLPNPGSSVYQLWLIVNNVPSPVVAFRPDSSGDALVSVDANLSQMQAMAVTLEKQPGNKAPKGPKVLQTA